MSEAAFARCQATCGKCQLRHVREQRDWTQQFISLHHSAIPKYTVLAIAVELGVRKRVFEDRVSNSCVLS
eukprot:196808-Amphidinium_carterae.2